MNSTAGCTNRGCPFWTRAPTTNITPGTCALPAAEPFPAPCTWNGRTTWTNPAASSRTRNCSRSSLPVGSGRRMPSSHIDRAGTALLTPTWRCGCWVSRSCTTSSGRGKSGGIGWICRSRRHKRSNGTQDQAIQAGAGGLTSTSPPRIISGGKIASAGPAFFPSLNPPVERRDAADSPAAVRAWARQGWLMRASLNLLSGSGCRGFGRLEPRDGESAESISGKGTRGAWRRLHW